MDDKFEIVVAHFNEDLGWLEYLRDEAIIYSKGKYGSFQY